jgi:hypothetical protein
MRRSALQKRLQRARKFLLLVDAFGMSVLDSVPEVSVSRVDVLRMEELRSLADGSCMKKEVESIRQKQDSLKGMVSTLLSCLHLYAFIALIADGVAFFGSINPPLSSRRNDRSESASHSSATSCQRFGAVYRYALRIYSFRSPRLFLYRFSNLCLSSLIGLTLCSPSFQSHSAYKVVVESCPGRQPVFSPHGSP